MPGTIACDESGSEGDNLVGANTAVFAHAGVRLDTPAAAACVAELRARIRSPALEYKANHLLRAKNREALVWFLGPSGPLSGRAGVVLIDKALFLTGKIVDLLVDHTPYPACLTRRPDARALALHRAGPSFAGAARWDEFLRSFTALLHTSPRRPGLVPSAFFGQTDVLTPLAAFLTAGGRGIHGPFAAATGPASATEVLAAARIHLTALREQLRSGPGLAPPLDPLMPALADTVAWWRPDLVVHDEQPSLTPGRLATVLDAGVEVRFVDSRADPRVQVADFLAGTARRLAEHALVGRGDAELLELLRPSVLPASVLPASVWAGEGSAAGTSGQSASTRARPISRAE